MAAIFRLERQSGSITKFDHQLGQNPRLGKIIQAENGWEIALETVLQGILDAVCLQSLDEIKK